jgi:TolB protein
VRTLFVTACMLAGCLYAVAQAPGEGGITQSPSGAVGGNIVTGGGDLRTPIAVPYFAAGPGAQALAKEMAEVVANDLDFTGMFVILPLGKYPAGFAGFPADYTQVDVKSWQTSGADYLVYAYVYTQGGNVVGEFRLIDIAASAQVMGKRLMAGAGQQRLVAHQFSDEVLNFVHRLPGMATSRIVFSGGATGKKELYIADYDGANARALTKHGSVSIKPKISPDGTKVVYVSYKDRYPFLYVLDVASGAVTPLSRKPGINIAPNWAPDSKSLVIVLSKDGDTEIYRVNADGSNLKRLTNSRGVDTSPCFSPDGRQIVFVSERGGAPTLYVMNSDGSAPRRLAKTFGKAFDPVWSPDGTKIAYVADYGGVRIGVMNADGSGARTLTNQGNSESPTWAPNSRHIMFYRTGGSQLRVVTVDTADPRDRAVPALKMPCQGPSWGPRRVVAGQ